MKTIFDHLENGNLTDAKRLAKRIGTFALFTYALEELQFSYSKALWSARFLKGECTFGDYCNATFQNRGDA